MRLAILMTNTDESEFAHRFPKDGEKFAALIHSVRPDWVCESYSVKDGVFPEQLDGYDGIIITGSPASVRDSDPWVARLLQTIRDAFGAKIPLFGACFGHQAIALALGGKIADNPNGWSFGLVETEVQSPKQWMRSLGSKFNQFAAHNEVVEVPPDNAEVLTTAPGVACNGFAIGTGVYTTQNHPEISRGFFTALLDEYENKLPTDVMKKARQSMSRQDDNLAFAETVAAFFEQAA